MAEVKNTNVSERPSTLNRSERPKRVPINGLRDKLSITGAEPGWHYTLVNEDNVQAYLAAGYDYVTHEVHIGSRKIDQASMVGGRVAIPVGNGVTGFLMRCPQEIFEEEMKLTDERTDATEQSMRKHIQGVQDGMYGKVDIGRPRRT